jgi:hypothetical protein
MRWEDQLDQLDCLSPSHRGWTNHHRCSGLYCPPWYFPVCGTGTSSATRTLRDERYQYFDTNRRLSANHPSDHDARVNTRSGEWPRAHERRSVHSLVSNQRYITKTNINIRRTNGSPQRKQKHGIYHVHNARKYRSIGKQC